MLDPPMEKLRPDNGCCNCLNASFYFLTPSSISSVLLFEASFAISLSGNGFPSGAGGAQGGDAHPRPVPARRFSWSLPCLGLPHPCVHQPRWLRLPLPLPARAPGLLLCPRSNLIPGPQRARQDLSAAIPPRHLRRPWDVRLPWMAVQPLSVHVLLRHLLLPPLHPRSRHLTPIPALPHLSRLAPRHPHHVLSRLSRIPHRRPGSHPGDLISSIYFVDFVFEVRMIMVCPWIGWMFRCLQGRVLVLCSERCGSGLWTVSLWITFRQWRRVGSGGSCTSRIHPILRMFWSLSMIMLGQRGRSRLRIDFVSFYLFIEYFFVDVVKLELIYCLR